MYFEIEGVDLEWGESIDPLIIKAQDREAAVAKARQSGMKVTKITPIPTEESPTKAERFKIMRTENTDQTETGAWSGTGDPIEALLGVLLVLAGVAALGIVAAFWMGLLDDPKTLLMVTSIFGWTTAALVLFSAAKVLELLADIAGSLRILCQRRPQSDGTGATGAAGGMATPSSARP